MGYQFKPYLVDLILGLIKTQTRRPFKDGDRYSPILQGVLRLTKSKQERLQWKIGNWYAVQPGRGKKGVGMIELMNIRIEDVREISLEDARAEGFETVMDFLAVWIGFYDPALNLEKLDDEHWHVKFNEGFTINGIVSGEGTLAFIKEHRPVALYKAWAHTFKLVSSDTAVQVAS